MDRPKIEVTKDFNASPEGVFDAWLDTEMLSRWMFGADVRDEEIISLKNDVRDGGTFSYVVKRGDKELDHRGTYRLIIRPRKLVFTWGVNEEAGDESVVTITITPTDTGCRLILVHEMDPIWADYIDRTREGWTYMLTKLHGVLNVDPETSSK